MKKNSKNFYMQTVVMLFAMLLTAHTAWATTYDGAGTKSDPFKISTTADLQALSEDSKTNDFSGVYFQLDADITFNKSQSNNLTPIASSDAHFQGHFDGNEHTISGICIVNAQKSYQGIFSKVGQNGVIENLKVTNTQIRAHYMSGVIAGNNEGKIENCIVGSDVELNVINPTGSSYGGITGVNDGGHVNRCLCAASITLSTPDGDHHHIGGIVGRNTNGIIENCAFTGSMQKSTFSQSYNCYAVVGGSEGNITISNCFYTNSELEGAYNGVSFAHIATLPSQFRATTFSQPFLFIDHKFIAPEGTTIRTASALHSSFTSTYCYFDVRKSSNNALVASDVEYKYDMPAYDITLTYKGILSTHSQDGYYIIKNEEDWNMLADYVAEGWNTSGKVFRLTKNVSASKPVGTNDYAFKGTFYGEDDYGKAWQLTFNATATGNYCAPFGHINGATLANLKVLGEISTDYAKAGGLVGKVKGAASTIQNCLSEIAITSTVSGAGYHGGLVSEVVSGTTLTMTNCIFGGSMQGNSTSAWGGLVSNNSGSLSMTKCLFAPISVSVNTSNCKSLSNGSTTINSSYYTTILGTTQGTRAYTATLSNTLTLTDASAGIYYNGKLYIGAGQTAVFKYLDGSAQDGMIVSGITAEDETHTTIIVTDNSDGTYSLTMPAKNITINGVIIDLWGVTDGADGTEEHPYIITTCAGLDELATRVNNGTYNNYGGTYFKLGADIAYTYAAGDTWDKENGTSNNYIPIGIKKNDNDRRFCGYFDGDNHTISGIRINSSTIHAGIFGQTGDGAEIKNIIVNDARMIAPTNAYVGGIVGKGSATTIMNCHVTNAFIKAGYEAGGIVGSAYCSYDSHPVSGCSSNAKVKTTDSNSYAGGIVGGSSSVLENCFYYGPGTTSTGTAGAIAGSGYTRLSHNYYLPCTVTGSKGLRTTEYGVGQGWGNTKDLTDNDGALPVYALTLDAVSNGTIDAATKNVTHNAIDYYKAGAIVTITATPADGYSIATVSYNDGTTHNIEPVNDVYSFTMPAQAVSISSSFSLNECSLANSDNNDAVLATWNDKMANITLADRTLYKDGNWNTLCLPFDLTLAGSVLDGDGVIAKVLSPSSSLVNSTLILNFVDADATIPAGTPFIIKWNNTGNNLAEPIFTGVTVNDAAPTAVNFTGGSFNGNYNPFCITDENKTEILLLSTGNRLAYSNKARTLGAFRAYFDIPGTNAARELILNFDDGGTTAIINFYESSSTEKGCDAHWCTLDGQILQSEPTTEGIYIHNGKKVVK